MDTKKFEQEAQKDGVREFVAGAVIVDNESILFVRRVKNDFMGGVYELPSGKVDPGESLIDALKREVLEETNLVIKDIIGPGQFFDYKSEDGIKARQFNFIVSVEDVDNLQLNPQEHDLFEWIRFEDIDSSKILDDVMKSIAQKAVEAIKDGHKVV